MLVEVAPVVVAVVPLVTAWAMVRSTAVAAVAVVPDVVIDEDVGRAASPPGVDVWVVAEVPVDIELGIEELDPPLRQLQRE